MNGQLRTSYRLFNGGNTGSSLVGERQGPPNEVPAWGSPIIRNPRAHLGGDPHRARRRVAAPHARDLCSDTRGPSMSLGDSSAGGLDSWPNVTEQHSGLCRLDRGSADSCSIPRRSRALELLPARSQLPEVRRAAVRTQSGSTFRLPGVVAVGNLFRAAPARVPLAPWSHPEAS